MWFGSIGLLFQEFDLRVGLVNYNNLAIVKQAWVKISEKFETEVEKNDKSVTSKHSLSYAFDSPLFS